MSARSEQRWKSRGQAENNQRNAVLGMIEGMRLPRAARKAALPPSLNPSRARVRGWMLANAADYETMTGLAEAASAAFRLPENCLDDETHWIWDEALSAIEREEVK